MFFRIWFYVCKISFLLFCLLLVTFGVEIWFPEAKVAITVFLAILIPMCIFGGVLGIAIFLFGMRLRCPYCNRRDTSLGGRNNLMILQCDHCGIAYGNIIRDFKIHLEPSQEQKEDIKGNQVY